MPARLYIDEDAMDDDLVQALRLRGADVQTALDVLDVRDERDYSTQRDSGPAAHLKVAAKLEAT